MPKQFFLRSPSATEGCAGPSSCSLGKLAAPTGFSLPILCAAPRIAAEGPGSWCPEPAPFHPVLGTIGCCYHSAFGAEVFCALGLPVFVPGSLSFALSRAIDCRWREGRPEFHRLGKPARFCCRQPQRSSKFVPSGGSCPRSGSGRSEGVLPHPLILTECGSGKQLRPWQSILLKGSEIR